MKKDVCSNRNGAKTVFHAQRWGSTYERWLNTSCVMCTLDPLPIIETSKTSEENGKNVLIWVYLCSWECSICQVTIYFSLDLFCPGFCPFKSLGCILFLAVCQETGRFIRHKWLQQQHCNIDTNILYLLQNTCFVEDLQTKWYLPQMIQQKKQKNMVCLIRIIKYALIKLIIEQTKAESHICQRCFSQAN